jgi:hypothetical protein
MGTRRLCRTAAAAAMTMRQSPIVVKSRIFKKSSQIRPTCPRLEINVRVFPLVRQSCCVLLKSDAGSAELGRMERVRRILALHHRSGDSCFLFPICHNRSPMTVEISHEDGQFSGTL